jgi:2-polyprenyl-6-methoxyphenol hydroxylase-like FAD-dependent oxidoreductase
MTTERTEVVIIGSGTGGALLAYALARAGIAFRLLERAPGPLAGTHVEILQPNGQRLLDQLGLLQHLRSPSSCEMQLIHFLASGGKRLLTIDYGQLPAPYNRAMAADPHAMNALILKAVDEMAPGATSYGVEFVDVIRRHDRVAGITARRADGPLTIEANLVVGADGARSAVRERLGLRARVHSYRDAYLLAQLDNPGDLREGRYSVGKGRILALFPAARRRVGIAYMIPAGGMDAIKAEGLSALRERWNAIDPTISDVTSQLVDWRQTAYMHPVRVRAARWVTDGGAVIGDAAHAMNPHASQGRIQAMLDAVTLGDVIVGCASVNDWSAQRLAAYERQRRPQVETLQRLADEQVALWNTSNPLLEWFRNRVFRVLDRNPRLAYRVLTTTAGFRDRSPFSWVDRLIAIGLLPDRRLHDWNGAADSERAGGAR